MKLIMENWKNFLEEEYVVEAISDTAAAVSRTLKNLKDKTKDKQVQAAARMLISAVDKEQINVNDLLKSIGFETDKGWKLNVGKIRRMQPGDLEREFTGAQLRIKF